MQKKNTLKIIAFVTLVICLFFTNATFAQTLKTDSLSTKDDSTIVKGKAAPIYRLKDTYVSRYTSTIPYSPFIIPDPKNVNSLLRYQPETNTFDLTQDFKENSNSYYKLPQALSFNQYASLQNAAIRKSLLRDYEKLQDGNSTVSGRGLSPQLEKSPILDKIFGGKIPEFKPNGFISVDMRIGQQYIDNPFTPIFNRRTPVFNIDPQISVNFNNLFNGGGGSGLPGGMGRGNMPDVSDLDNFGNIGNVGNLGNYGNLGNVSNPLGGLEKYSPKAISGDAYDKFGNLKEKVGVLGNFDTKSAFNYENQFRISYRNEPENILQKLEMGNVSLPNRSQLIPGVQNLQGIKAGLRFGKLDVTTVIANQRSRTESIIINGGAQSRPFEIRCDSYDENRHFFLGQFFRDNYERSLRNLPMILSGVRITRVEVYVTNRSNTVTSMRNLVGLADLGEPKPYNETFKQAGKEKEPISNKSNALFAALQANTTFRSIDQTNSALEAEGLRRGDDFEILRGAKRLTDREFDIQPELGYISLYTPLRNDEVLAVSYEFTYNGRAYRVGELSEDYSGLKEDQVVMLKLLKSSTIRNRLNHPMWNLMMKNVYSLGQGEMSREGFQLRVIYKDDRTGMDVPNLQEGENLQNRPLIEVMKLDKLNYNLDPQPDGNFDYIENVTINEKRGLVIFPVLEPFGSHLSTFFKSGEIYLKEKYVFNELYRNTLTDAQQISTKNKFFISGQVQLNTSEIPLPLGASAGSVRVYAGGVELKQGSDYTVDQQLGRIRLMNQSILNSARQIRIDYERPDLFQSQVRRLFGTRLDYTVGRYLRLGATFMDLKEQTPGFLTRTAIGNEPVDNTIWGVDINYKKDSRGLTRFLDKLPIIETKEISSILFNAEFAQLLPGVNDRRINGLVKDKRVKGSAMVDDFEAARTIMDLTRQPTRWRLGATPSLFDERGQFGEYGYNYRRALMSVYTIDVSSFLNTGLGGISLPATTNSNNIYEKAFVIKDIFPGRSMPVWGQQPTAILDVSYFPQERGMYNYNPDLTKDGFLKNAKNNFGAFTRGITTDADFDNANVEYLEFWLLDPFADAVHDGIFNQTNTTGGKLLFQLGDISEDAIPDSRNNFENGLQADSVENATPIKTLWGKAPRTQFVTDAFANSEGSRQYQDVGLDGLSNAEEKEFFKTYVEAIEKVVTSPNKKAEYLADPSGDDFTYFLNAPEEASIIERFKHFGGMENNAPVTQREQVITPANTNTADKEDLNNDNTINDIEDFYEYEIDLKPGIGLGQKYIVDKVSAGDKATWYLYRIPLDQFSRKEGNINGFKSVRFMRMVMTGWEQPVVCRFATLQLVANQYRVYPYDLATTGLTEIPEPYDAQLKVATVNIEENGCDENGNCNVKPGRTPYVVPPGFRRDRDLMQIGGNIQFNEQAMSLSVTNLRDGDARAVFKNTKVDMNMYKRLQMFIHAENPTSQDNYGVGAFVRIGTDLKENYYEIEIPDLKITPNSEGLLDATQIWPYENEIDFPLDELRKLKIARNISGTSLNDKFTKDITIDGYAVDPDPEVAIRTMSVNRKYKITVVGNPDLSNVLTIMLGLSNPTSTDQEGKTFTLWMNELRVYDFDQTPGEAGIVAADIKLADIGTVLVNANLQTFGFGGVQDRISTRSRETARGFGIATNLDIDKLLPEKMGFSIPFFMSYDQQQVIPHFDPLDPDIPLEMALAAITNEEERAKYRQLVVDNNVKRGFNFTNIRKVKKDPSKQSHFYDIENFALSYAQNTVTRSNILIQDYLSDQSKGGLSYLYQPRSKPWEPFRKTKFKENKYQWVTGFNLSPIPSTISVRADFDRSLISTQFRNDQLNTENVLPNIQKYFMSNRFYDLQWNLSRSLNVNYKAVMNAINDNVTSITAEEPTLLEGISRLGRPKTYNQGFDATWRMPLDKIYILDWLQADASYNNMFSYRANALGLREILEDGSFGEEYGNYAENGRDIGIRGRVDLVKLYNKFKYLKFANSPTPPKERYTRPFGTSAPVEQAPNSVTKTLTRLLMTVRGINFNYSNQRGTILPGFLPSPQYFGLSNEFDFKNALPFVLGNQRTNVDPTQVGGWLYTANQNGWLSKSSERNDPFIQSRQMKFDYNLNLEPWKGFRMQINGKYAKGDDYQVLYRPTTSGGELSAQNLIRNGNLNLSFWSFNTLFVKDAKWEKSTLFELFKDYRSAVANHLNTEMGAGTEGKYDISSQDVLITAFIAAYSGKGLYQSDSLSRYGALHDYLTKNIEKSDGKIGFTNLFRKIPFPNWRIDFSGVEKLPLFKSMFSSITINHSYSSTYNVGNFTSSLSYGNSALTTMVDLMYLNLLSNKYTYGFRVGDLVNTALYSPLFVMSTVSIEEKFAPIIGVNFVLKNGMSGRVDWNLERRAGLNLSNLQVADYHRNDFVFTIGYRKNNVKLPMRGRDGNKVILKNDLNFSLNFTINDLKMVQRPMDAPAIAIQGNYNFQLRPQIQYQFNKKLSGSFYVERLINNPFSTASYARRSTIGGLNMRFNLAD